MRIFFTATLLLGLANFAAAQSDMRMLPGVIENFELPNFDETSGYKDWELFGETAQYISHEKIDITQLKLDVYDGKETQVKKLTFTSPKASVSAKSSEAKSTDTLKIFADGFMLDGKDWHWYAKTSKLDIAQDVFVNFEKAPAPKMTIKSQSATFTHVGDNNTFLFKGGVIIERLDMKTSCDELSAVASKSGGASSKDGIKEVVAKGHVNFIQGAKSATGGIALISPSEETVTLLERPELKDADSKSSLTGAKIFLDKQQQSISSFSDDKIRACAVIIDERRKSSDIMVVSSDKIVLSQKPAEKRSYFDFMGRVEVISSQFNAHCDTLRASSLTGKNGSNEIDKIDGNGNVKLLKDGKVAAAESLEIFPEKSETWLQKNASLEDESKGIRLDADTIILLQEQNSALAIADKQDASKKVVTTINQGASRAFEGAQKPSGKTVINSGLLHTKKYEKGTVLNFSSGVEIISDDAKATCKKMDVYADNIGNDGEKVSIKQIVASEDVVITQENYVAEAELAHIFPKVEDEKTSEKPSEKPAAHRFVELLISEKNPAKRPLIKLPELENTGLEDSKKTANKDAKISHTIISSDKQTLVNTPSADRYFFEGNVKISGRQMQGSCEKIEVIMRKKPEPVVISKDVKPLEKSKVLDKIIMSGNVQIAQGLKQASCGKAEIYPLKETIVLTQNPLVINKEDNTRAVGARIIYVNGQKGVSIESGLEDEDDEGKPILKRPTIILPSWDKK